MMQWVDDVKTLKSGETMYDVYGQDRPGGMKGMKQIRIGTLKLNSAPTESYYGDNNLHYRHQNMEEDLKLMPSWRDYTMSYKLGGKCPYETMLQELGMW